jgi:predicted ArsR family transcriptional regulator
MGCQFYYANIYLHKRYNVDMAPTTRARILDHLRKHDSATAKELSRTLSMTGANIRHHLGILEAEGLIEVIGKRQEGKGRPVGIYGLSRRVLGDGLVDLVGAMFHVWASGLPEEARRDGLRSLAHRLSGDHIPDSHTSLSSRLGKMIERLNELHYQAKWEAGVDGPKIILGQCPYAAIIGSFPEICQMDSFLIGLWTGVTVDQTARLQANTKGRPYCCFQFSTMVCS